jgi:two-component system, NarL family, response regulator NreC
MNEIRLLLVDDHEVVRIGLKSYLETKPGLKVVGEADSGEAALLLASEVKPDVVVMDITMPKMDGLEATRRMMESCPQIKILALTVHEDKQYLFEMLAAGASGYLSKHAAAEELADAVRTVANGGVYLQPTLARWLLEDYRRLLLDASPYENGAGENLLETLSDREQQVLELIAKGLTGPQIGERLGISHKTVARHRERIMAKLNLHSSTELVKFAIRAGLIHVK